MARPLRICFEGAWYHVMNRGVNKEMIFFNNHHYRVFLELLGKTKETYDIEIHAYCLMGNHYHLIIHTPRGNISEAMRHLNSTYARIVNTSIQRDGPLFRGRFKAILISADDYLIRLSRYIHLNPLKAKMVNSIRQYKWSSYPAYIGQAKPETWLSRKEIVSKFGDRSFRINYKKYVEDDLSDTYLDNFYKDKKLKPVLGGDEFCQLIDSYMDSHNLSSEVVGKDRIVDTPSMQKIVDTVAKHFDVDVSLLFKINKQSGNSPRQIAIYICRKLGKYTLQQIADFMGIRYKGISKAIARISRNPEQLNVADMLICKLMGAW